MSNLLKRALKISLTPAILIIAVKVLGILLLGSIYGFDMQIGNDLGETFSTQIYISNEKDALFLNSLSDGLTLSVLVLPLAYMIVKVFVSRKSLEDPRTIIKLTKANLLKWVTDKETSFLKVFIWTVFLWIVSSLIIVNTLQEKTYIGIGVSAGICALISAWCVLHIFEIESNKLYPEEGRRFF